MIDFLGQTILCQDTLDKWEEILVQIRFSPIELICPRSLESTLPLLIMVSMSRF